jgi:hypothetical protein
MFLVFDPINVVMWIYYANGVAMPLRPAKERGKMQRNMLIPADTSSSSVPLYTPWNWLGKVWLEFEIA